MGMVMPEDVEVGRLDLVPLSNGLIHWNRNAADTTSIANTVAMVEPHDSASDVMGIMVAASDRKTNTLLFGVILRERHVKQPLIAVLA